MWRFVYRAVDGYGQVIDVYVSSPRDIAAARKFFTTAIATHREPDEVVTDRAAALANVIEELLPHALPTRPVREQPSRWSALGRVSRARWPRRHTADADRVRQLFTTVDKPCRLTS